MTFYYPNSRLIKKKNFDVEIESAHSYGWLTFESFVFHALWFTPASSRTVDDNASPHCSTNLGITLKPPSCPRNRSGNTECFPLALWLHS
jgi:hypothetical protein